MRKLLFILFLFPFACTSQPTFTVLASDFNTAGIAVVSGNTYTAGRLYIFFVGTSNDAGTVATTTLSGTGQTWTECTAVGGVANGGNRKRIQAFRFAPGSNNTNQTDFNITGVQDGMFQILVEVTGVAVTGTNGSDGVVQNGLGSANNANPTLTLSTLLSGSSVLFCVANGTNPFAGTEESGWSESIDGGYATPDTGGYLMSRSGTSDNTPTITKASGNWAGIALEFRSSARRITITN
jgi:hypothetical protein